MRKIRRTAIPNQVLAALPAQARQALQSGLEPVELAFGEVLYEPGERIRAVYFPGNCLISLLTLVDEHVALEVGLVGREGMLGMSLTLGGTLSPGRALVQGAGSALRMDARRFAGKFAHGRHLRHALYRYLESLMTQISQTAACNLRHVVEERLARWLLMTHDRLRSDRFRLTHEFLAHMLGVRRPGVSEAASALERRGLIAYSRGDISILDRRGLEAAACSCYAAVTLDSHAR